MGKYCVTVSYGKVRGNAKNYRYWQPAMYKVVFNKKRGCLCWKYVRHLGRARRSERLATIDAEDWSKHYKCEFDDYVRNWYKADYPMKEFLIKKKVI